MTRSDRRKKLRRQRLEQLQLLKQTIKDNIDPNTVEGQMRIDLDNPSINPIEENSYIAEYIIVEQEQTKPELVQLTWGNYLFSFFRRPVITKS
jgi:hypothetical protein